MKKSFTLFIIGTMASLQLASCSGEAFDVDSINKQTILVYMPWSGSETTQKGLKDDIDSISVAIRQNKGLKNARVLVMMSENANENRLYEITYNSATFLTEQMPITTYEGSDYATAAGMARMLQDAYSHAESLNYALIMGTRRYEASTVTASPSINTETLGEGIKLSGKKMQYVFLDGSYMGTAAAAYDLREATNFLIASSSEILADHIPYTTIWKSLNSATPSYAGTVSSYCAYFSATEKPFATLTAIDCRQIEQLSILMKELNSQYSASADVLAKTQHMDKFSPTVFYDLGDYVDSLKVGNSLYNRIRLQLSATVKASQATAKLLTTASRDTIAIHHYSGITFCDPSTNAAVTESKSKTAWWKATH